MSLDDRVNVWGAATERIIGETTGVSEPCTAQEMSRLLGPHSIAHRVP